MHVSLDSLSRPESVPSGPFAGRRLVRMVARLYLTDEEFTAYRGIPSIEVRFKDPEPPPAAEAANPE